MRTIFGSVTRLCALSLLICGCSTFRSSDSGTDPDQLDYSYDVEQPGVSSDDIKQVSFDDGRSEVEKPDASKISLSDFAPTKIGTTAKRIAGYGPDQKEAISLYTKAEGLYNEAVDQSYQTERDQKIRKQFVNSAELFNGAAGKWPDSALQQDALFYAGEAYFFADEYAKANDTYEMLIKQFPGSRFIDKVEARRFVIARYWLDIHEIDPDNFWEFNLTDEKRPLRDTDGNAIRVFDRIRLDDPTGKLADDATFALATAYMSKERYLDAAETYEDLRRAFPSSRHQFNAHVLELRARLEAYQGARYDGDGLAKADVLLRRVLKQFPEEAKEHRDYLNEVASKIRYYQAEREMAMAEYFDRRGEYRAAKMYYDKLVEDFSDTPQGEKAAKRIVEISDKPPVPSQKLKFLVDLFPEPKASKPLISTPRR